MTEKNKQISTTFNETKKRRKNQSCVVYKIKFDKSHLSKKKKEYLNRLFLEAKWLYNFILSQEDIFTFDTKIKIVKILNKDKKLEDRELKVISSQMKQSIHKRLCQNIINLAKTKKTDRKTGHLKFKSFINSIPLKQFGITYKIENKRYIKIQGFKRHFKVNGLSQIPESAELANATLVKKNDDYHLMITCFIPKVEREFKESAVGIDFGIKDSLALSNGEKFKIYFPVSKGTRLLQRKFRNKKKNSKNWRELNNKIRKAYAKTTQKKIDAKNKVVSYIVNNFETVCVQDENIKGWHEGWFGKSVQFSILGGIMRDLKRKSHILRIVDRYFPSTKMCSICGRIKNISLDERIYTCECGNIEDRDVNSANNILLEGLRISDTGCITLSPVEVKVSTFSLGRKQALVYEAGSHNALACGSSQ